MKSVKIVHVWGDKKTVPIETIERKSISIRWGLSGVYDIDLKTGEMRARSAKARRKGPCHWKAADIESLRQLSDEYFNPGIEKQQEIRFQDHIDTMPLKKLRDKE